MNFLPAFGLGLVSGLRSMMGLAFFSDRAEAKTTHKNDNPALALLKRPETAAALKFMAAGEVIMDKMPFMPARTEAVPLMGRLAMGAFVGAAISKKEWIQGAAAGAAGALVASYAAYSIRKLLHDEAHIPNVVLGIAEDAVVVKAADAIMNRISVP
ncbi:MAG: DUF4126 family protein [Chloroflexi bacterium]|nr:DUF4126 family protein [Chloroflexota bacterium]MCC6891536.1 DUF4126 family protein [Anaerolineae bacterium]